MTSPVPGPRRLVTAALAMALALPGCDSSEPGSEDPLRLGDVFPTDGASGVPVGSAVTIAFPDGADAASLEEAVTIRSDLELLPATVDYDEARRVATVSVPLLPVSTYTVRIDTTARAPGGGGLEAIAEWAFTTAPWQSSAVAEVNTFGELWGGPALARAPDGRRHQSYYSGGFVHHASCGSGCGQPGAWSLAEVLDVGRLGFEPSLAVDGSGGLHLLGGGDGNPHSLHYFACATQCGTAANWTLTWLEGAGDILRSSLQVGSDGALHAAGYRSSSGDLAYGHCAAACADAGSWTFVAVAEAGDVGQEPSLALDAGGRLHVAYLDATARHLSYATCAASCTDPASWTATAVSPETGAGRQASIAAAPGGGVAIAYYDETARDLRYALCREGCTGTDRWTATTVEAGPDLGRDPSLVIDRHGRAHLAFNDFGAGALRYATCAAACESAASWRVTEADGEGDTGRTPVLAVGNDGSVTIAYLDFTNGNPWILKVLE